MEDARIPHQAREWGLKGYNLQEEAETAKNKLDAT